MESEAIVDDNPVVPTSNVIDVDTVGLQALETDAVKALLKPLSNIRIHLGRPVCRLSEVPMPPAPAVSLSRQGSSFLQTLREPEGPYHAGGAEADLMNMLSRVAAVRDEQTGQHTKRMAHYAAAIACAYGFSREEEEQLRHAAPLHDIGNVAVPDHVLGKTQFFTDEERRQMERHTTAGHELLRHESSPVFRMAAAIALAHHEHWDGSGYPLGLSGEQIPISARLVAVADMFDALTTVPFFEQSQLVQRARDVIVADAGGAFDPAVVDAFVKAYPELVRIKRYFDGGEVCTAVEEPRGNGLH